jgi:hypothetical protein
LAVGSRSMGGERGFRRAVLWERSIDRDADVDRERPTAGLAWPAGSAGGERCGFCGSDPLIAMRTSIGYLSMFNACGFAINGSLLRSGRDFGLVAGSGLVSAGADPRLALHGQPALRAASRFLWERSIDRDADVDRAPAHVQRCGSRSMDRSYGRGVILAGSRVRGWFCRSGPRLALHGQPALRAASRFLWERSIDRDADVDRVPEHVQRCGFAINGSLLHFVGAGPRLALHGQPALRAASDARRNPRAAH